MNRPFTILYVDEGLSFGGSIVSVGYLVRHLDKDQFRAVLVGEMGKELLDHYTAGHARIYTARHLFNYARWWQVANAVSGLRSSLVRKAMLYALSLLRAICNLPYTVKLLAIIAKERVDLVHMNNGLSRDVALVSMIARRPCLVHLRGVESPGRSFLARYIIRRVAVFIAISDFVKDRMLKFGLPRDRIVMLHNPVHSGTSSLGNTAEARASLGIGPDERVFGIFGRIARWKGHEQFVAAATAVLRRDSRAKAFIVGDSADASEQFLTELKRKIRESDVEDRIVFTGFVKDVATLYSVMDVVVHASIEPEPFGRVIAEAMACGTPVVASRLGATGEIITDGYDGILVDPHQPDEVARAIRSLLENDAQRGEMGQRAREKIVRAYDPDAYTRRVERLYREILTGSARARTSS